MVLIIKKCVFCVLCTVRFAWTNFAGAKELDVVIVLKGSMTKQRKFPTTAEYFACRNRTLI